MFRKKEELTKDQKDALRIVRDLIALKATQPLISAKVPTVRRQVRRNSTEA